MAIVHHSVYAIWYEIARMDFFARMGFSFSDMDALGINPPMVDLHMQYRSPVTYPGTVTIKTSIVSYAPKKLELRYETWYEGKAVAEATTFHIWTGPDMKSLNMEEQHPEIFARIVAAAQN
jgi:acyl-CoA thioester hydrolase